MVLNWVTRKSLQMQRTFLSIQGLAGGSAAPKEGVRGEGKEMMSEEQWVGQRM